MFSFDNWHRGTRLDWQKNRTGNPETTQSTQTSICRGGRRPCQKTGWFLRAACQFLTPRNTRGTAVVVACNKMLCRRCRTICNEHHACTLEDQCHAGNPRTFRNIGIACRCGPCCWPSHRRATFCRIVGPSRCCNWGGVVLRRKQAGREAKPTGTIGSAQWVAPNWLTMYTSFERVCLKEQLLLSPVCVFFDGVLSGFWL